jgi:hypothetical protein
MKKGETIPPLTHGYPIDDEWAVGRGVLGVGGLRVHGQGIFLSVKRKGLSTDPLPMGVAKHL